MEVAHASISLICELTGSRVGQALGWSEGPARFEFPNFDGAGTQVTSIEARSQHFAKRAAAELYGDKSKPVRRHRMVNIDLQGHTVIALEELEHRDGGLYGVVHLRLNCSAGHQLLATVDQLRHLRPSTLGADLASMFDLAPTASIKVVYHVVFASIAAEASNPIPAAGGIPPEAQWLRLLSAASNPNDTRSVPPDTADPEFTLGTVHLSGSWRAQALHEGAAFVGIRMNDGTSFLDQQAPVYVRSIYLDSFLLGISQLASLQRLADEIADLDPSDDGARLDRLRGEFLEFRQRSWWQHIAASSISDRLLIAYQSSRRAESLFREVTEEIEQFSSQMTQRAADRANALLAFVAVAAFMVSVVWPFVEALERREYFRFATIAASLGISVVLVRQFAPVVWKELQRSIHKRN